MALKETLLQRVWTLWMVILFGEIWVCSGGEFTRPFRSYVIKIVLIIAYYAIDVFPQWIRYLSGACIGCVYFWSNSYLAYKMNETIGKLAHTILAASREFQSSSEDGVCSPYTANVTG